jgi:hypothetical protein
MAEDSRETRDAKDLIQDLCSCLPVLRSRREMAPDIEEGGLRIEVKITEGIVVGKGANPYLVEGQPLRVPPDLHTAETPAIPVTPEVLRRIGFF